MIAKVPRKSLYRYAANRLNSTESDHGYFEKRLRELKEQNTIQDDDPLAKLKQIIKPESLVDQDKDLKKLYEAIPQKEFDKRYNGEIHYSRMLDHIDRQSKEIALSRPWTGKEAPQNTALRMLLDATGRPNLSIGENIGFVVRKPLGKELRPVRAGQQLRRKLESAQDHVLMYKSDRRKNNEDQEQSEFRALYAEKFTPIGSFEKIRSLADQRIEEGRRNGGFDGLDKMRGRPLNLPRLDQHMDRTEHYLNSMLARQKVVPPWIEAQSGVNRRSTELRIYLVNQFEQELVSSLEKSGGILPNHDFTEVCTLMKNEHGSTDTFVLKKFAVWKLSFMPHMVGKIETLNKELRDYNLQAPLSLQKLYLRPESEFQRVLKEINLKGVVEKVLQKKSKEMPYKNDETTGKGYSVFASFFGFRSNFFKN